MRDLTYFVAVTLDGFIAAPDDTFDAFPMQGAHIDWIFEEWIDTVPGLGLEMTGLKPDNSKFDAVLMGWGTYAAGFPHGTTDPYPHLESYVITHHPDREVPGDPGNVTLTDEDPVALVRRLKQADGAGIWLCGGGLLASTLVDEIDRLVFKVNPIMLGDGKRLFGRRPYAVKEFELTESRPFETGVVVNSYVRR
jgi:dihydrofolate reductase